MKHITPSTFTNIDNLHRQPRGWTQRYKSEIAQLSPKRKEKKRLTVQLSSEADI
jgi:hypothetical protein